MKIRTEKIIDEQDWSTEVEKVYKRPYRFQQQEGCRGRGLFRFTVPDEAEDYEEDSVPEIVNHGEMGVSFEAWLKRDPKAPLTGKDRDPAFRDSDILLWWHRNFYPDFQMVANDLYKKGLLEAGDYTIDIDW